MKSGENGTKAAVQALADAVVESWNSHDMARFGALFAEDADFVNVVGHQQKGRTAITQAHVQLHATIFRNSRLASKEVIEVRLLA